MKIEIEYDEVHYKFAGLGEVIERGRISWRAYLQERHGFYLQGGIGSTPQAAVDQAAAAMERAALAPRQAAPIPTFTIGDIDL